MNEVNYERVIADKQTSIFRPSAAKAVNEIIILQEKYPECHKYHVYSVKIGFDGIVLDLRLEVGLSGGKLQKMQVRLSK